MTETVSWQWSFPGGTAGLVASLLLALIFVVVAYRRTLRLLRPGWRWTLTLLRSVVLIGLILCLASPQQVRTRSVKHQVKKPVAVLVDTSGSMVRPDARGVTRLAIAQQALARIKDPSLKLYRFGDKLEPVANAAALAADPDPRRETHFLESLGNLLSLAPPGGWGAVIALTDGNDTTPTPVEPVGRRFRDSQTPLILAATQTDLPQGEFVHLAQVSVPPSSIVHTQYPLDVLIQSETEAPRRVTVRVLQNNVAVAETELTISPGPHTQKASFHFTQDATGPQDYQVQLIEEGKTTPTDTFYASTRIGNRPDLDVLYFAGALNIEYRFLRAAFTEDPSVKIESAVHVSAAAIRHQLLFGSETRAHFEAGAFPANVADLAPYKVIVLADVLPAQLDADQTNALLEYVKQGGGVIFLVANTVVASDFSNSDLEQLLPVVFEPKAAPNPDDAAANAAADNAASLRFQLDQVGNTSEEDDAIDHTAVVAPLLQMSFTPDGRAVLGNLGQQPAERAPKFREYAAVQRAKPGAIVAAEHPTDSNSWGKRPLLVMQHFGQGRSAVLATDSVWRWQLSLPSTSRAYQRLWKQMLFWVANQNGNVPVIDLAASSAKPGEAIPVKVTVPSLPSATAGDPPTLTAYTSDGSAQQIPLTAGAVGGTFIGVVTAPNGPWLRLEAASPGMENGLAVLNIRTDSTSLEDQHLVPDLPSLRRLAEAAGGQVVDAAKLGALPALGINTEETVTEKKVVDLWDNGWIFIPLLALFCFEMLLRRWLKLL
jgi:uncharacterized membrane protein